VTTKTVEPTLPRYAEASLDALATSILASVGVPGEPNPLQLPAAERVCLLLIDGLGWELLRAHQAAAQFMNELAMNASPITTGFPATTATSLASLGTGRTPGEHGLLGYQVAIPGTGRLLNALRWDDSVDPVAWQPGSTVFERLASAGIRGHRIASGAYRKSGLSIATMRGAHYVPADTLGALVSRTAAVLSDDGPAFASVYHGDLDATGHRLGCSSDAWQYQLAHVDKLAEQLAGALPSGTVLYITADHGMTDVPAGDRVDVDSVPELRAGVALLGGEPRARHVYAQPGAADDVLATWRTLLGDRAWVASREQAIAEGWFGPVDERFSARIGDVVAAACGPFGIVATHAEPGESALVGMHGSLTQSDQHVPMLTMTVS
jgi:hypothetical protein